MSAAPYIEMKSLPSISQAGIWNPITAPELQGDESQPSSYRSQGSAASNRSHRQSLMGHTAKEYVCDNESTFFKRNKKKIIFGSIGACCFIFVVVMIGLIVPIVMLTKTSISETFIAEVFSLCEIDNPYMFNSSLKNPSIVSADLDRSKLSIIRTNDSNLLFTTWVPHVRIKPGTTPLSISSNLTVENETAATELINSYLRGDWVGFKISLDANIRVWGIKIRHKIGFEFVFPGKTNSSDPSAANSSAITLQQVTVLNSTTDVLAINIGLDLNHTSTVIIHAPSVELDLYYNNTDLGQIITNPFILRPGISAFDTALLFPRETVDSTSVMAYNMANGNPLLFEITGSRTAPTTCLLQRVLRNVTVALDLSSSSAGGPVKRKRESAESNFRPVQIRSARSIASSEAFVLGEVALQTVDETNVTVIADFSTSMPVYGQLQSIVFEYFTDQSAINRIGVLTVDIAFNGQNSRVTAVLSVEQFPPLGSWLTSVTATPRNELAAVDLMPSRTWINMATGILKLFKWNFPLFSGGTSAPTSDPPVFKFNRIAVLGNPLGNVSNVVAIGADFYLKNERFMARFPLVNITVSYSGMPILAVTMLPLQLTPGVNTYSAEVQIFSLNPGQIQTIVDDSWTGSSVALTVLGPAQFAQLNVLQKVLSYWSYQYAIITAGSQSGTGSETVDGGTLPKVDMALTNSTLDTISLGVSLPFNSPLEFAIHWGSLLAEAAYNSSDIISGRLALTTLNPGNNFIVANVTASAVGSRRTFLEDFASRFAYQRAVPNIELKLTLSDPSYKYSPVVLHYGFSLPDTAGGGSKSGVMRCTEMGQANPGLDLSGWATDLLLGDWTWPACTIDSTLSVWFSNPLPFPLTILMLKFDLTFRDPDGLADQPFKLLTYIPGISGYFQPDMNSPFAQILEPHAANPSPDPDGFGARPAGTQLDLPLLYAVGQLAPFNLIISTENQSPITGTPSSDPHYVLCIRLAEQYYNNKLTVDMRHGLIRLGIGQFVITLSFEMTNYFVGGADTVKIPCKTQLGIPN